MANKTESRRVNLYINGKEVTGSIKSIQAQYKKLVAEQRNMTLGSKQYQAQAKKISKLKKVMDQHHQSINKTAGAWSGLQKAANSFNKYFMMITAGIAIFAGLVMSFRKAADASMLFEERLDNLSALTGLIGKQLSWLGEKAKETSIAIIEAGGYSIRIKQSASDIVDAYTKMGSQRPELLKNKEALHEVTLNAILLSEAAKGLLEPSVTALATTMNQFNKQATDSRDIINTIAAGSKAGAANVEYLSTAIEKAGTTMALMGIEVEQGIAIIETVAPKFAQATKAGNSLDKVFLKMKTHNIGYVKGVFDMNIAMDELRVRFAKGEMAVDVFGERHAKMVEIMVQGQSEYNRYLDLVTDSDIALEQAAKNTDNRATILAQAKNRITLLAIELGDNLSPALTKAYTGFGSLMKVTMALPRIFKENKTLIYALTGAYLAYNAKKVQHIALSTYEIALKYKNIAADKLLLIFGKKGLILTNARAIATKAHIAISGKMTIAQGRAIIAQRTLNATMKANPLGIVLIALTALIVGFRQYNKYSKENIALELKKNNLMKDLNLFITSLKEAYKLYSAQIGNLNTMSYQEKIDLKEKIALTLQSAEARLAEVKASRLQIKRSTDTSNASDWWIGIKSFWVDVTQGRKAMYVYMKEAGMEAYDEAQDQATEEVDVLIEEMEDNLQSIFDQQNSLFDILYAESDADEIGTETLANIEEKINLLQLALFHAKKGSDDYLRIQNKIAAAEKERKSFDGNYSTKDEAAAAKRLAAEKIRIEKQLWDTITQLRRAIGINELSGQQKEIQQVQNKYDDLINKAGKYGLDTMVLANLREQEISAIIKKWGDKTKDEKIKAQEKINQILRSDRDTAVQEATKKYQDLIALAEKHGLETTELYQAMNDELAAIKNETFGDEGEDGIKKDIFGMEPDDWDNLLANVQAAIVIAQQFGEIWASVNARRTAEENHALSNYEANIERRKELLNDQLESGLISQTKYDKQIESLDDQLERRKKDLAIKQWKRDKELRLFSAIINTAAGITQALGSMPPPASYILAALTGVLGGVQIAAIANEPPPAFRYGGYTPDRPTQILVGDGSEREWVASGDLVNDPQTGPIIQQLEDYQRGRRNNISFSPPIQPDIEAISSTSAPQFSSSGGSSYYSNPDSELLAGIHSQMQQMNENNAQMNDFLSDPKNRRSTISYDLFHEYEEELSDIQSLSRTNA